MNPAISAHQPTTHIDSRSLRDQQGMVSPALRHRASLRERCFNAIMLRCSHMREKRPLRSRVRVRHFRDYVTLNLEYHPGLQHRRSTILARCRLVEDDRRRIAEALFRSVQAEFDWLYGPWFVNPCPELDLELIFEVQPGLDFRVIATLQGDELCLCVGEHFFGEWFPCTTPEVAERFAEILRGVLLGEFRLIEYSRGGRTFKAAIEQPTARGWSPIATWSKLRWPSFSRSQIRILQNNATTSAQFR